MTPAESATAAAHQTELSPDDLNAVTGGIAPVSAFSAGGSTGWQTFYRSPVPDRPRAASPVPSRHETPALAPVLHPTSRTLNVRI